MKGANNHKKYLILFIVVVIILGFYYFSINSDSVKLRKHYHELSAKIDYLRGIEENSNEYSYEIDFKIAKRVEEEIQRIEYDVNKIILSNTESTWGILVSSRLQSAYFYVYLLKLESAANYLKSQGIEVNPELVEEVLKEWEWEYVKEKYLPSE